MSKVIWNRCIAAASIRRMVRDRKREDGYKNPERRAQHSLVTMLSGMWELNGSNIAEYRVERALLGRD